MSSNAISIIALAGTREQLQMAGMVASVGAVSGHQVTVFLSMNALRFFVRGASGDAPVEGEVGRLLGSKKAPHFKTLFQQAAELGDARIHPCSMALDILGLKQADLEPYIGEPLGLTKFLDDARAAQVWSF
jgi:peroxiredoxin family protein